MKFCKLFLLSMLMIMSVQHVSFSMSRQEALDILGLQKGATIRDIKKSYTNLGRKWHPDKWMDKSESDQKNARQNFDKIAEAYAFFTRIEDTQEWVKANEKQLKKIVKNYTSEFMYITYSTILEYIKSEGLLNIPELLRSNTLDPKTLEFELNRLKDEHENPQAQDAMRRAQEETNRLQHEKERIQHEQKANLEAEDVARKELEMIEAKKILEFKEQDHLQRNAIKQEAERLQRERKEQEFQEARKREQRPSNQLSKEMLIQALELTATLV